MRSVKPPQIQSNIIVSHVYRFVSNNGEAITVSSLNLLGAAGVMGTVANTDVQTIFASVKVHSVTMWGTVTAGDSFTVSCEWEGAAGTIINNAEASDTSTSVAYPAYLFTRPPKRSSAEFWMPANGTTVFTLTAPSGTIIDVHMSLISQDDDDGQSLANYKIPVSSCTVGTSYYLALDGPASNEYIPVSLTTTH